METKREVRLKTTQLNLNPFLYFEGEDKLKLLEAALKAIYSGKLGTANLGRDDFTTSGLARLMQIVQSQSKNEVNTNDDITVKLQLS